ncbi:MAG TPA: flagellar biosynthetic protein FliR, partial [Desulfotignum sp.]|nr:flagellar biosynthetic protein FliR [Desulfotignum sp.]
MAKLMALMAHLFLLAIKIGAPVIAALMFVSAGFGLVAKFSPQMNVMIVAFPLKIIVGLFLFGLSLDIIAIIIRDFIPEFKKILLYLLFFMGGG